MTGREGWVFWTSQKIGWEDRLKNEPCVSSGMLNTLYDTIGEFNVDWKAEYSALSSTRSQKKKLKQPTPVPL